MPRSRVVKRPTVNAGPTKQGFQFKPRTWTDLISMIIMIPIMLAVASLPILVIAALLMRYTSIVPF